MSFSEIFSKINEKSHTRDKFNVLKEYKHPPYTINEVIEILNFFGSDYHYNGDHASLKYMVLEIIYDHFNNLDYSNFLIIVNQILDSSRPRTINLLLPKLIHFSFTFDNFVHLLKVTHTAKQTEFIKKALTYNVIDFNSLTDLKSIYDIMKQKCSYTLTGYDLILLLKIIDIYLNSIIINEKKFKINDFIVGGTFTIKTTYFCVEITRETNNFFRFNYYNNWNKSTFNDFIDNKKIIVTSDGMFISKNDSINEYINDLFL